MSPACLLAAAATLVAVATAAAADCASDAEIAAYVADWQARRPPFALSAGASMEDAFRTQARLVARLGLSQGAPVGHKAGLTSTGAQARFAVPKPVRGVLLANMRLEDGARMRADFGTRLGVMGAAVPVADAAASATGTGRLPPSCPAPSRVGFP